MDYPFHLSVLIPCYNVERYLDRSLWCLEQQWDDEESMEIIFVNDCSTDGTLAMLQSFCRKHPHNTVLINKERNGGFAQACNDALRAARGRWITFFSPDDALSSGAYQAMFNDYLRDDIGILSFQTNIIEDVDVLPLPHYKGRVEWEGSSKDFYNKYLTDFTWIFIYSHELLDRLGVTFTDLPFFEETLFNLDVFLNDGIKVRRVDCKSHYHFTRHTSLSSIGPASGNTEMIDNLMAGLELMEQKKQAQDDSKVVERITWKQKDIAQRFVPSFICCDHVDVSMMKKIRRQLMDRSIYPYSPFKGGMKHLLSDLLFRCPRLLSVLRPALMKAYTR